MVFQNLFKEYSPRLPSDFVGRNAQLDLFSHTLKQFNSEPNRFIINISGQAGVGKTTLLRQYQKAIDPAKERLAVTTETEPDVPGMMGKIAEQFKQQGHILRKFNDRYRTYLQCLKRLEADPEKPQGLAKTVGQAATKVGVGVARQIPGVSLLVGILDENTLAAQGGEWFAFIAKKLTNQDDVRLVQSPIEVLTPLFFQDLRDLSTQYRIILFFDAYERTSSYLDKWLRDSLIAEQYGKPPARLLLVIAGQQELSRTDWSSFQPEVIRQSLQPFTEREGRDFLKRKGITEESLVTEILEQSARLPLLLNTLAVQAPTTPTAVINRAEDVIDRYLHWVEDPQKRKLVLDAALARSVNRDVIATLTSSEQADALFDWLIQQPFVNRRPGTWGYEPLMQKLMVRYKRQRTVLEWVTLHDKLAQLYQQLCDIQGLDAEHHSYNSTWQSYQLEKQYHQLCQAPLKFLQPALLEFLVAFKRQPLTARLWAETIHQAGEFTEFDELAQWGEQLLRGLQAYEQDPPTDAIALFTRFLKQVNLEPEWQAKVLSWRGQLYGRSNQYASALADLNDAIGLMPQTAEYYRDRGLVYLLDEQYSSARSDFNQALKLHPEDAKAIAYRGMAHLSQLDCPKAVEDFTYALKLQPDFQTVLVSRAAAFRVLGDYEAALVDLHHALELLPGDESAIAQRGKTYQAMERPEKALSDFNQVLTQHPDHVEWLIHRGIVYQQLERYEDALIDFNRVLDLHLNQQEALANRGETYRRLERYDEAIADLSRVIEQNSEDAWAFGMRGTAYRQLSCLSQSLNDLNQAIALEPQEDWWYYNRSLTYRAMMQAEMAQTDLNCAIQISQKHSQAAPQEFRYLLNLALYYLALSDIEQSVALYRAILGKCSPLLRRGAIRELQELLVAVPPSSLLDLNSASIDSLKEILISNPFEEPE